MFPRSTLVKSGDKKIRYWKLVENYHTQRGTRQRVVAHLGSWENPRKFGDVYVALRFWQTLGLGKLFSDLLVGRSAEVNCLVAALMAANRPGLDPGLECLGGGGLGRLSRGIRGV